MCQGYNYRNFIFYLDNKLLVLHTHVVRNTIHYHVLAELEKEPSGLSTDQLFLLVNKNHFVENKQVSEKSIQRALKFLNENISIQKKPRCHALAIGSYKESLSRLLHKNLLEQKNWKKCTYGSIHPNQILSVLLKLRHPVNEILNYIKYILQNQKIKFTYKPTTELTLKRLEHAKYKPPMGYAKNTFPVTMLPRLLVFAGSHVTLLGEAELKDNLCLRQYEIHAISKIKILSKQAPRLVVDAEKIYNHSLEIWAGDKIYEVRLREYDVTGHPACEYSHKVNGVEEIISKLESQSGALKMVNPPEAIVSAARERGIDDKKLFDFEKNIKKDKTLSFDKNGIV